MHAPPVLTALLALVPGVHSWWSGRALLARMDDPAFPELLFARMQRSAQIIGVAAVVVTVFAGAHWVWALPLLLLALLLGSFPLRRALYDESWGVADYVRYSTLGFVGGIGFWVLVAFAPALITALAEGWTPGRASAGAAIFGAVLAVGLFVWEYAYPVVWLALHRATPLDREDLRPQLEEIVRRSGVRPPQLFRFGARGSYVMNAIALPSTRQPRVAFGDSLLELLDGDEIAAVFAHEVAHLEHYNPRRLLRLRMVTYLLVLGGTVLPGVLLSTVPARAGTAAWLWPLLVLGALALRVSRSQKHETESDLRAAALTGDPEPMVRALTKLHHFSRMPRRWPYDVERTASHPSLARRVQALRAQGPAAAASLGAPTVLRSTEPGTYAALDDARAYWFEGVPASIGAAVPAAEAQPHATELPATPAPPTVAALREHAGSYRAVAYADLTELRVGIAGGGRALFARDRAGKKWSVPLHADDVAAAQRALDVLDVRLASSARNEWATRARTIALLLALALFASFDFGWAWVPLLATLAAPSVASVAAMGTMAVARVLTSMAAGMPGRDSLSMWIAAAVALGLGAWACWLAWRWSSRDESRGRQRLTLAALGGAAAVLVLALALAPGGASDAMSFLAQPAAVSLALVMLGAGAALLTFRDRMRRGAGGALAAAAVALGALALGGEHLAGRVPSIAWTDGRAEVVGGFRLEGRAYRVHLSPSGRQIAVQSVDRARRGAAYDDEEDYARGPWRYFIGGVAGAGRTTEALDLAFLDDDRVLALRGVPSSGDSLELAVERAAGGDDISWRRRLPPLAAPTLAVDRDAGTWAVTGYDGETRGFVIYAGAVGAAATTVARQSLTALGGRPLHTDRDGASLVATMPRSFGTSWIALATLGLAPFRWDVWRVAADGRRRLGALPGYPDCGPLQRGGTLLCVVRGRKDATLWRVGTTGSLTPLGVLPAGLDLWRVADGDRIAAGARDGSALGLVDVGLGRATRVTLGEPNPAGRTFTMDVAVAPGTVATLAVGGDSSEVRVYRVR